LKYFEAGMDLRLSTDPYESFRIFQGRILEQYLAMSAEFNFLVIDANQLVEAQQSVVRELISQRVNLGHFKRKESYNNVEPVVRNRLWKEEGPYE
jgi:dTMP kinase